MSIYLDNGYLDIEKIMNWGLPFNFVVGGRGTGKTYGALKYIYDNDICFMLMRRTQAQCDLINKPEFNPFKTLVRDLKTDPITVKSVSKYNGIVVEDLEEEQRIMGYTCALSTIANMRGFDSSDVKLLMYDEFIPEKHERAIKNEGSAFLNAYETINRNRELSGEKPLQVLGLANAFNIANAIFLELGLVGIAEKLSRKKQEVYINKDLGVSLILLQESDISKKKKETALYKITSGSFSDMSINNDFAYNDNSDVSSRSLAEYNLLCSVGELHIYKHKSKKEYYISEHKTGSAAQFSSDEVGLQRYRKKFGLRLYHSYMNNHVHFETMLTKSLFELYTI